MLERNKIYLGDSYKLIKDLPDNSIDCVYTDVPYLYEKSRGKASTKKSKFANRTIKMTNTLIDLNISDGFDYSILDELVRVMKKINIFIWCSKKQILDIMNYFDKLDCDFTPLVWTKTNPAPLTKNVWLPDIEYCIYFREPGVKLNDGYELKSRWYNSSINVDDKKLFLHPTIKPLPLVERHLKHTTQPGDLVLDCFLGSGTTAMACKNIGRDYIGFEISEKYYKISCERLNGITATGQTSIFTNFENVENEEEK